MEKPWFWEGVLPYICIEDLIICITIYILSKLQPPSGFLYLLLSPNRVDLPPISLACALDFPWFPCHLPPFCKWHLPIAKILWFHTVKNSWKIQGTGHSQLASSEPVLYLGFSLISLSPTLVLQSCPYLCFSNIHIDPKSRKIQGTGYSPYLGFSLILNRCDCWKNKGRGNFAKPR